MKIEDFVISINNVFNNLHECLIKYKDTDVTFGVIVQSDTPPTPPWVFHHFTTKPKEFFINV